MDLKWNLTNLFENTNDFYQAIEEVKQKVLEIKEYETIELDENSLYELLEFEWAIKKVTNDILIYGSLRYYKNVKSDECINLKKIAENFSNDVNMELRFIERKILNLGYRKVFKLVNLNSNLEIYDLSLKDLFRKSKHIQSDEVNIKIKKCISNITTQINLYNEKIRDIKYGEIDINGKKVKITTSNFAKFISAKDRKTRRDVYFMINSAFMDLGKEFSDVLNSIYGNRIKIASLEKYNSVLEKVLFEENINPKIISTLISSVHDNLYLAQRYLKMKSDFLKIENPHLYDLNVSLKDDFRVKYSIEEAVEIIKKALEPLGEEYLKVVDILLDGHIDSEVDENKHQSITFSWNTYSFMNFRGSYVDLKNMIHELGHIVNYYFSHKNLPFIYEDSTIFVGEVASIVNEILLNRYLYLNSKTEEEKIFYLSKNIENYFTSVFKQTLYTEFENDLYQTKLSQDLTFELVSNKYGKFQRKYYGSSIVYDDIADIEWMRLGHLYRWSYYPYKYATGLIIASVVVRFLLDEKSLSKEEYIEFLSSGSSLYSLELLEKIHIDLTDVAIINDGFKLMESEIKELSKILRK